MSIGPSHERKRKRKPIWIDFLPGSIYNPCMSKNEYPISQSKHSMLINTYIQNVHKLFLSGKATELSYRSDLQVLLSGLLPDCQVTNEPRRIDCGAPDYIITRKEIPVGYIEAKDIGHDLNDKHLQDFYSGVIILAYGTTLPALLASLILYRDEPPFQIRDM